MDIATVRRSRRPQGQAAEGHSKQHRFLSIERVDDDHLCCESLEYNCITNFTDIGKRCQHAPSAPENHREPTPGPDSDGRLVSMRQESQSLKDGDVFE